MENTPRIKREDIAKAGTIITESGSIPGLYNIGNHCIASGILEWARKNLCTDLTQDVYEKMITGAEKVPPGSNGARIIPKDKVKIGPGDRKFFLNGEGLIYLHKFF
ncbi:MAG: hypothetical protein GX876_05755 [Bacteroidales bacterium]|nr:hypothetical protein [Bacteroidales bacterium]